MTNSIIIRNATLVLPSGLTRADLQVRGGKITKIAKKIASASISAHDSYNAQGKFVLPGLIDSHVHLRDFAESAKEDFFSGTSAAIAGGVTSVIDMPNNALPTTSMPALHSKALVAQKKALCDYGFHFGATNSNLSEAADALKLPAVAGIKAFMGSSTGSLLVSDFPAFYAHALQTKKPLLVHAEDNEVIRYFHKKYLLQTKGKLTAAYHSRIRSEMAAEVAASRAVISARNASARLHICHLSTQEELVLVRHARDAGQQISVEVTPHHLFLDESATSNLGNFAKVNPPLRNKRQVAALWNAISVGEVTTIGSDHAPHTFEEKKRAYAEAPSGVPGLETMLPLLLNAASQGKISLEKIASLCSANPAKLFGIKGKGSLSVGNDADLVVADLGKETTVKPDEFYGKCKWSPFAGWKLKGAIERVYLRGEMAFDGASLTARLGKAKALHFK